MIVTGVAGEIFIVHELIITELSDHRSYSFELLSGCLPAIVGTRHDVGPQPSDRSKILAVLKSSCGDWFLQTC